MYYVSGSEGAEDIEITTVLHSSRQFGGDEGLEPM